MGVLSDILPPGRRSLVTELVRTVLFTAMDRQAQKFLHCDTGKCHFYFDATYHLLDFLRIFPFYLFQGSRFPFLLNNSLIFKERTEGGLHKGHPLRPLMQPTFGSFLRNYANIGIGRQIDIEGLNRQNCIMIKTKSMFLSNEARACLKL